MKRDLLFEREYRFPPELVWEALTDPEALAQWLMPNDFAPVVGHKFKFWTDPKPGFDGITYCEVLEVDRPRSLAYSFVGGGLDTVIRYTLRATETGTQLQIAHTGFSGWRAYLISFFMQMGVSKMYDQLLPATLQQLAQRFAKTQA